MKKLFASVLLSLAGIAMAGPSPAPAGMKVVYDKMEDISWIYHSSTNQRSVNTMVYAYFGVKGKKLASRLRFVVQYGADSWLFAKSAWVLADGERFPVPTINGHFGWTRDNSGGRIWEISDVAVDNLASLKKISQSKSVTIRFVGDKYHSDYTLTKSEIRALAEVISEFEKR